jgi:Tfp pilus assembly protein PilO
MNKLNQYRLFAVLVPLICLALGGWIAWNQNMRLAAAQVEHDQVAKNLEFQKKMIADIDGQLPPEKDPTVQASDAEQAEFLDGLRTIAGESGVTLTRWSNVAAPPPDPNKPETGLPKDVQAMISTLEVNGSYPKVRAFLYSIARAPRLLNFSGIRWSRGGNPDSTLLSVTITRYVSTAPAPAPATADSTAASSGAAEKSS